MQEHFLNSGLFTVSTSFGRPPSCQHLSPPAHCPTARCPPPAARHPPSLPTSSSATTATHPTYAHLLFLASPARHSRWARSRVLRLPRRQKARTGHRKQGRRKWQRQESKLFPSLATLATCSSSPCAFAGAMTQASGRSWLQGS